MTRAPTPVEQVAIDVAAKRAAKRTLAPVVVASEDGGICSPHDDQLGFARQLCDTFGTRSQSAMQGFFNGARGLARDQSKDLDVDALNMALAITAAARPKDELQAALAVGVARLHLLGEEAARRAMINPTPAAISAAARCVRAQAEAVQALQKLKRKASRQIIKVKSERHIHVHQHGERDQGGEVFDGQAQATTQGRQLAHGAADRQPSRGSQVRGQDQGGGVVQLASRRRKEAL